MRIKASRSVCARAIALSLAYLLFASPLLAPAQEARTEADINAKIRDEGMNRSQIMRTLHFFTDVYGPRLTGSPNLKAAGEWAIKQMQAWGLENGHLEPWEFGHPGWTNERLMAHIVGPVKEPLVCEALAWTPSTNGFVTAPAYQMILPARPTQEEFTKYLDSIRDQVKGRIVLVGKHQLVPVTINTPPRRLDDAQLRARFAANVQPTPTPTPSPSPTPEAGPRRLSSAQMGEQLDRFLKESGVLVRVNDAAREHGQIRAFNNRSFDPERVVPTVIMRNEDYGRISRLLADGRYVMLEFNIQNRLYPEGTTAYNTIAEIPGTDKRDEVIMLGGHLDSWHAATGATDNAAGCAIMMEAARILKALGVKPRRTIRVALWSGEEQGLLGSRAYVKEHFGTFENPKPDYSKFGGYFNIDTGTGRARGLSVFGPPEAASILREAAAPFAEWGVVGVLNMKSRGLGGSDNTSFNQAGLPGIGVTQDPIEYFTHTWHTNLDTYERIIEDDVKKAAVVVATVVYHLAMRDGLLPRFKAEEMPKPPAATPTPTPAPALSPARLL